MLQGGRTSIIMTDITIGNIVVSTQIADKLDIKRFAEMCHLQ